MRDSKKIPTRYDRKKSLRKLLILSFDVICILCTVGETVKIISYIQYTLLLDFKVPRECKNISQGKRLFFFQFRNEQC